MTDIIPFDFEHNAVRVVMRGNQPWFILADVCRVLSINNHRDTAARLDNDEKGVDSIDTLGGTQQMTTINESGLYRTIMASRKPAARRFTKWVTSEVLPAIRRDGVYRSRIAEQDRELAMLHAQAEVYRAKAAVYDAQRRVAVLSLPVEGERADGLTVGQIARRLGCSRQDVLDVASELGIAGVAVRRGFVEWRFPTEARKAIEAVLEKPSVLDQFIGGPAN